MSKQQEALRFLDDLDSLNADTVAVTIPSNTPSSSDAQATTTQGATINQQSTTTAQAQAQAESQTQPANTTLGGNEADALAFLDEITQKSLIASQPSSSSTSSARSTPPSIGLSAGRSLSSTPRTASRISLRKGADGNVSLSRSASPAFGKAEGPAAAATTTTTTTSTNNSGANSSQAAAGAGANSTSWGWSSVWSSASAAVKQARTVVDEQVKNLPVTIPNVPIPNNEQAKKWSEGMLEYVKSTQLDKIGS